MNIQKYSDKSFCVRGESTKQYSAKLRELGGTWNRNLKGGPGWIFSDKHRITVQQTFNITQVNETIPPSPPTSPQLPLPVTPDLSPFAMSAQIVSTVQQRPRSFSQNLFELPDESTQSTQSTGKKPVSPSLSLFEAYAQSTISQTADSNLFDFPSEIASPQRQVISIKIGTEVEINGVIYKVQNIETADNGASISLVI